MYKYIVQFTSSLHTTLALSAIAAITMSQLAQAAVVTGQGTWETTLQGRDLDGNASTYEAYYDTTLNITWLADANYAKTMGIGSAGGTTSWSSAKELVAGLNVNGFTGWRLPDVFPAPNGVSFEASPFPTEGSELSHLYYVTLGNASGNTNFTSLNTGPFANLLADPDVELRRYWLDELTYYYSPSVAVRFNFQKGYHDQWHATSFDQVWPVFSGDIAAVPEPTTQAMMGIGLMAFIFAGQHKLRRYQASLR